MKLHSSRSGFTRRAFLAAGAAAPAALNAQPPSASPPRPGFSSLLEVDYQKLVSRADLTYNQPVSRSEEGMPVGNGRMGSLVWTTPSALHLQINRVDVYPISCTTHSFPIRHTDYATSCGYVDISFADYGEDVFTQPAFRQHLSVFDGLMTASGSGITARVIAWNKQDVMAVEVDDRRSQPQPISIDLRMLRYAIQYHAGQNWKLTSSHTVLVRTASHLAASRLEIRRGKIVLVQEFREGSHFNSSAVAIGVAGRESKAKYANEAAARLTAAPGYGKFTVLIGSAATFNPEEDVAAKAVAAVEAAAAAGFDAIYAGNRSWWQEFWRRGFVHLHSKDKTADFVEQHYTYFLYVMASSSRGSYPPRFGGMLWFTNGDMRAWGSQHWWNNTAHYYRGLIFANRLELMDPVFNMYSRMYDSCARAAREQWDSQGIWIPETVFFDGLEPLPEDIAVEMRDLYLLRKPWEQRSRRFLEYAATKNGHNSRWNFQGDGKWVDGRWVFSDKGAGPFGHVTHIMATAGKIAFLYWLRYECTGDTTWLRERAYPMLKGAVEFYRNFPNLRKESDGKYHLHHVNNGEGNWNSSDTQEELYTIRGITPLAIRAAEILGVDADLRSAWKEFLENLAPLPTNETAGMRKAGDPLLWVTAAKTSRPGDEPRVSAAPASSYDLCTLETDDPEMVRITRASYEAGQGGRLTPESHIGVLSSIATTAAHLGRADHIRIILPNQIRCLQPKGDFVDLVGSGERGVLANRMTLREGPGAIDCQRLGEMSAGLHEALLQSSPPAPGKPPVLRVFGAWPEDWDAEFTLLARGAFLVTSSFRSGKVEFVELLSQAGWPCRIRNPWGGATVTLYRNGMPGEELSGTLLSFQTRRGELVLLVPKGTSPETLKRKVVPESI